MPFPRSAPHRLHEDARRRSPVFCGRDDNGLERQHNSTHVETLRALDRPLNGGPWTRCAMLFLRVMGHKMRHSLRTSQCRLALTN